MDTCNRIDPPVAGSEKELLSAFLDWNRATFVCKLDGLTDEQLRQSHQPSGLTLLGMMKHLAHVERGWFRRGFAGEDLPKTWTEEDPDRDWRIEPEETTADIRALYQDEIDRARMIVGAAELDAPAKATRPGEEGMMLRWIVIHMIEETARHAGHADLIREAIDGQTGE